MATRAPSLGKKKKICFLFSLFLNYPTTFFWKERGLVVVDSWAKASVR